MARRKRQSKARNKKQPLPSWVWLTTGLIIGLSATIILKTDNNWQLPAREAQDDTPVSEADTKRKFDFYTLLPELEVVVPAEDQNKVEDSSATSPDALYLLQVGSFKNYADADKMKASLALMGIESEIEKVTVNGQDWHRVRVGPERNRRTLQAIKNKLAKQKIDTLLLKVRS